MLENSRIKAGRWEAVSHEKETPDLEVRHQGEVLEGLLLTGEPGDWRLSQPIPAELLSEGVLTFLVCRKSDGEVIDRFSLVAGAPLAGDLRAEIDLLRTELDMLSRAFRQHCAESES
ncbi:hypothetical protein B6V73_10370 [Thioclava sp. JM3]|uniref:hypothetical protein n=1 Tax=unclassified Thioclava TaxID=2621713 RepID=UPI000B6ECDEF|nr:MULTISPECIES: hypothetical protein [unclassified Thioclava]OWY13001.1 hypothetical protein B6V72_09335 [Thioclava sp. F34-6]OWY16421.1 hypothetical protein B6V73_10370 [Thioclava sp. JM3]